MKKIFFVLLINLIANNVLAQGPENAQPNNTTLSSADIPVSYVTGIPDISIDLLQIPTINPDFNLDLKLHYDLNANTSVLFSTKSIGDFWKTTDFPKITRTTPDDNGTTDELFTYSNHPTTRGPRDVFTYEIFGLNGKFQIKRESNNFKLEVIEQSDYAKIEFDAEIVDVYNKFYYRINSFSITDKGGFKYVFSIDNADYTKRSGQIFTTNYNITNITDRFNNLLMDFNYQKCGVSAEKCRPSLKYVDIKKIGTLEYSGGAVNYLLTFKNLKNEILKKIEFQCHTFSIPVEYNEYNTALSSEWSKNALLKMTIFSNDNLKNEVYRFEYNENINLQKLKANQLGFLMKREDCNDLAYAYRDNIHYDAFVLNKITYPSGGSVFYDFEPNDFSLVSDDFDEFAYEQSMEYYKENNSNNFSFQNIPLVHDPANNRYLVNQYAVANAANYNEIFVNYDANYYPPQSIGGILLPIKYPKLIINAYNKTTPLNYSYGGITLKTLTKKEDDCELGYKVGYQNQVFTLQYDAGYLNLYNSITAKVIIHKPNSQVEKKVYGNGLRIKKITSFDTNINLEDYKNKSYSATPTSETTFDYKMFNDPTKSSGNSKYGNKYHTNLIYHVLKDYSDFIYYQNVSVKTTGLGEVQYTFNESNSNSSLLNNPFLKKLPSKIVKKDENGNIIEENSFTRTFKQFNPNLSNPTKQPVITYEKVVNRTYVNGNTTPLELITESHFDTISRNLTSKKIINALLNETFEEKYTYVKHNEAYLPKKVDKFKNGIALNRSENFYTPIVSLNGSFYNLRSSQIAKANLPLEVENEYTKYNLSGKLQEYKTKDGVYVSQIWGYNGAFVIAELHNIKYGEINGSILSNLIAASNQTGTSYNEGTIRGLVDQLRTQHPNAKIKSYTYNPVVGITSVSDVNGVNELYEYDSFNRLFRVKDHNGLILKEYNYNYKNQ